MRKYGTPHILQTVVRNKLEYKKEILGLYLKFLKFIYSEKATKLCEIYTLLLTGTTQDKSKVKLSQNFVAFSEYMNFNSVVEQI